MERRTVAAVMTFSLFVALAVPALADFLTGQEAYLMGDYVKAIREFKSSDEPRSLYQVGYMYDHGEGVDQDGKEAAEWYRKAADKGYPQAEYRLGVLYENGYGVDQNLKEAEKWYKKASMHGFLPAKESLMNMKKGQ
jgi:uncharacterized protein